MKRRPVIRHLRYYWHRWRVYRWARTWARLGIGLGWPNQSDLDHLKAIWEGKA